MKRATYQKAIHSALKQFPVVALLGPRQSGKTTLAREIFRSKKVPNENYFDLEDPEAIARLREPKLALEPLRGIIIIDEIQRNESLFPILRVLVDKRPTTQRYLILGSVSQQLLQRSSESLAGRIRYIDINPFSLSEIPSVQTERCWLRGGYPRAFLAKSDSIAFEWLEQYIRTFLERDIPNLGIQSPPEAIRRLWMMISHYHGQILNASEFGRSLELSDSTVKRYIDLLCGTFMVRRLSPWFENISKRQVKQPKLYIRDTGIFHRLLGIGNLTHLRTHPKLGSSWEGFVLEQLLQTLQVRSEECFFWGIHGQGELDLLILKDGKRIGFEIKYSSSPKITRSLQMAQEILKLDETHVIYPGKIEIHLSNEIVARPLSYFLRY